MGPIDWPSTKLEPPTTKSAHILREFSSGATRDTDIGKHDFEGYLSPLVLNRFGEYMTKHRKQSDGSLRASDNWQKGIPEDQYMKSAWRHFMEWWTLHRSTYIRDELIEEALCALLFNVMGYLHEWLKEKKEKEIAAYSPRSEEVEFPQYNTTLTLTWEQDPDRITARMTTPDGVEHAMAALLNVKPFDPETRRKMLIRSAERTLENKYGK